MTLICRETADGISLAVKVMPKSRQLGLLGLRVTGDATALLARIAIISTELRENTI